jgi:hypothetical protein
MSEIPHCLAMLLCDQVYREPTTRKNSILGTFEELTAPAFPARLQFTIFFAVTGGVGPNRLKVRLIHSDALLEGAEAGIWIELPLIEILNPLAVVESSFTLTGTFHAPGQHHLELYANDELLMMRRLTVHHRDQSEEL